MLTTLRLRLLPIVIVVALQNFNIGGAVAESMDGRTCIFAAALKLPPLPGLTVVESRTKPGPDAPEAARLLAQHFATRRGANELANYGWLNAANLREIESALYTGSSDRAASIIATAVTPFAKQSLTTEIDVRAVGQNATFSFLCLTSDSTPVIVSLGISR